jgi:hypothetical protein
MQTSWNTIFVLAILWAANCHHRMIGCEPPAHPSGCAVQQKARQHHRLPLHAARSALFGLLCSTSLISVMVDTMVCLFKQPTMHPLAIMLVAPVVLGYVGRVPHRGPAQVAANYERPDANAACSLLVAAYFAVAAVDAFFAMREGREPRIHPLCEDGKRAALAHARAVPPGPLAGRPLGQFRLANLCVIFSGAGWGAACCLAVAQGRAMICSG